MAPILDNHDKLYHLISRDCPESFTGGQVLDRKEAGFTKIPRGRIQDFLDIQVKEVVLKESRFTILDNLHYRAEVINTANGTRNMSSQGSGWIGDESSPV